MWLQILHLVKGKISKHQTIPILTKILRHFCHVLAKFQGLVPSSMQVICPFSRWRPITLYLFSSSGAYIMRLPFLSKRGTTLEIQIFLRNLFVRSPEEFFPFLCKKICILKWMRKRRMLSPWKGKAFFQNQTFWSFVVVRAYIGFCCIELRLCTTFSRDNDSCNW